MWQWLNAAMHRHADIKVSQLIGWCLTALCPKNLISFKNQEKHHTTSLKEIKMYVTGNTTSLNETISM